MTTRLKRLVQQLDDSSGPSYDARAELIGIGSEAVPALVDGLPSLGGFGQLTAIEVFEEVGDPRCGPALICLLGSDHPTVREWAAMALASLETDGATEPLRRAHRACLERATPYGVSGPGLDWEPDWTAPSEHLVEESRAWSLLEASEAPVGDDVFVAPTWIDRTDLHPER
ncbi:HEAT repeat domain-containing protein [Streptomyces sp. NPDC007070]|uniref:HEAT repeat domain-containing protein n=1 Tax=Streptomyces sp. NPDC007070 TaxID=3154312 RepID=UPI0033F0E924